MAYCEVIKLPGGGTAIARISGKRPAECDICKTYAHRKLCDAMVRRDGKPATCDKKLCDECATKSGKYDFCPEHKELA